MLVIFCLIFSASVYSSYSLSKINNTVYTLIDPTVVSKIDGEDIVVVQLSDQDRTVAIKCTKSECALLTTGTEYGSLVYIGNDEEGILQYVAFEDAQ